MSKEITPQLVMSLRKRTGVGMSKCKEALIESNGDIEQAIDILRKKGIASAVKKGGRETNEGVIGYAENDLLAFLVEVNAETDFVIQNDRFKEFLKNICDETLLAQPKSLEDFLGKKLTKSPSLTIDEYRAETVHSLGENIQIKRILDLKKGENRSIGIYSHMGGKIVAAVVIEGASGQEAIAREVAIHIVAEAPSFLKPEDVPADVIEREKDIAKSQIQNKPAEIMDKIIRGKMNTFYEQSCLLNQKYVKDPSMTVQQFIEKAMKDSGQSFKIIEFVRWQIGE